LRIPGQGDLAGAFTAALKGTAPPAAYDCIAEDTIAFLQQESFFDAKNPNLARAYRDVPWEEPALLRELLLEPWPNRRLMARAWHFFRPPNQPREVRYEPALAASPDQDFAEGIAVADNG
ncbi:MAG: hypothetical protein JOZ33_13725, partial [Acidobacteriaceae bacterium]|nr:hypothetical protein [Acidobacteriaceae bacterium]